MKYLPKGMVADRDNVVYYDTEKALFYFIQWIEVDGGKQAKRIYLKA